MVGLLGGGGGGGGGQRICWPPSQIIGGAWPPWPPPLPTPMILPKKMLHAFYDTSVPRGMVDKF